MTAGIHLLPALLWAVANARGRLVYMPAALVLGVLVVIVIDRLGDDHG